MSGADQHHDRLFFLQKVIDFFRHELIAFQKQTAEIFRMLERHFVGDHGQIVRRAVFQGFHNPLQVASRLIEIAD